MNALNAVININKYYLKMRTKKQILKGEDEEIFMLKCALSPELFTERVLGFTLKKFHREWFKILENNDRIAISAPTGFGKTTIFGVAYPLWQSYFYPKSQTLIISKTIRTQSANVLEEIKRTIENNEILYPLISKNRDGWTKEKINMENGAIIFYSSYTQNVRGVHVNYTFCDEVATWPESETYFRDVVTRIVAKKGKLAAVSTCLNTTDLLAQLMDNPSYYSKKYPAIINNESIWPEKFPVSLLMKIKKEQGESNFEKNYMCNPRSEAENTIFSLGRVMEGYDYDRRFTTDYEGKIFIGCDFAIAKGPRADFDAYVAIDKFGSNFIIKHIEVHKGMPTHSKVMRIKQIYDMFSRGDSKPVRVVIDETGIGQAILDELRGLGLPIVSQSFHSAARSNLLMNLKNIIDSKKLVIPRKKDDPQALKLTDELTVQLIGFKETKTKLGSINYLSTASHDDIVMALAMAVKQATLQKSTSIFVASSS